MKILEQSIRDEIIQKKRAVSNGADKCIFSVPKSYNDNTFYLAENFHFKLRAPVLRVVELQLCDSVIDFCEYRVYELIGQFINEEEANSKNISKKNENT